jgi:hypothetical protein
MLNVKRYTKDEFESLPTQSNFGSYRYKVKDTGRWVVVDDNHIDSYTPIIVNPGTTDYPK